MPLAPISIQFQIIMFRGTLVPDIKGGSLWEISVFLLLEKAMGRD